MTAKPDYLEWLDRAKRDLETAELLLREKHYTDVICFHTHQAVEKCLKALFCRQEKLPPKTHNIGSLLGLLVSRNPDLEAFRPKADRITSYYIESRYPAQLRFDYSIEEAERAIQLAREIFILIEKKCREH